MWQTPNGFEYVSFSPYVNEKKKTIWRFDQKVKGNLNFCGDTEFCQNLRLEFQIVAQKIDLRLFIHWFPISSPKFILPQMTSRCVSQCQE